MLPIRISIVSYLNSRPFLYGIEHSDLFKEIQLSSDTPAICARKLLENEVDLGLVPVAILPLLPHYSIIGDYCIGAVGAVTSVILYSEVPLHAIKSIWLDYQSRTSLQLTRVLARHFWKIAPVWQNGSAGFENKVKGDSAALVIGDRTFELKDKYRYAFDLGEEWFRFTGLPFVFACWVTTKKLPDDFIKKFNQALDGGIQHIPELARGISESGQYPIDVFQYLQQHISYRLDREKRKGLERFLGYLSGQSPEA